MSYNIVGTMMGPPRATLKADRIELLIEHLEVMGVSSMTKRIDLTQFERILDGPWSLVDGSEVQTKGPRIWQYIISADIGTGLDMRIAAVEQSIDEIMAWGEESNLHEQIANYHLPPKEERIALATAKSSANAS